MNAMCIMTDRLQEMKRQNGVEKNLCKIRVLGLLWGCLQSAQLSPLNTTRKDDSVKNS